MKFLVHPQESIGEYIGEYQILSCLGIGKIGSTYHVRSSNKNREYALKVFRFPKKMSLGLKDRFEAFISLWSQLSNRHINKLYSSGKWNDFWFIVKEFIHDGEGQACSAEDYLKMHGGHLSPFQIYHIASQLGHALSYLEGYKDSYRQGLFHGNLKPQNIMLAWHQEDKNTSVAPFEVRLTDLDPYQIASQDLMIDAFLERRKTLGGDAFIERSYEENVLTSIYNSAPYASPEVLQGKQANLQDDFFAIGQLIYYLATGGNYFGKPPSISKQKSEFSHGWDEFIEVLLSPEAKYRFQSAEDYLEFIKEKLSADFEEHQSKPIEGESLVGKKVKPSNDGLTPVGMVYIPKGVSLIGNEKCGEDALPQHEWESQGFYIDRVPVTNRQFAKFIVETGYVTDAEGEGSAPIWMGAEWKMIQGVHWKNPSGKEIPKDFPEHPVTQVSLKDAKAYAEWLGRRLPTEKEWEFAAKGGLKDVDYPWGNLIGREYAHYSADGTSSVMSYPANGYGLYDMAGNVWEWTDSWYKAYSGNLKPNAYFGERFKVVRGGAWLYDGFHCLLAYRNANQINHTYPTLGFRTVCDIFERGNKRLTL